MPNHFLSFCWGYQ